MPPHQRTSPQIPSLSTSPPLAPDGSSRTFIRLSSLKQSIRTATRSKKPPASESDEPATIAAKGKCKEVITVEDVPKERDRINMFGKLGTTFRRTRKDSSSQPSQGHSTDNNVSRKPTYTAPSLRGASLSSPALHLSSQALPSPKSQPSIPASSLSGVAALVSPARDHSKRASNSLEISSPVPIISRRERQPLGYPRSPSTRHRATKSNSPDPIPTPLTPSRRLSRPPDSQSPRRSMETDSLPETPTPSPLANRGRLVFAPPAVRSGSSSPRDTPPISPLRARSPPRPCVLTPTTRGLTSSSTSHLPSSSSPLRRPSLDAPRRSSIDAPHRSSIDSSRRPSVDSPRRSSGEIPQLSPRNSPVGRHVESPTLVRPRPISPQQRSYAQNRHYNISSASLIPPPFNAEHREQIRKAASMLCKEMIRPPSYISKSDQAKRDWEAVEIRIQPLARLERVWGMSSVNSSTNLNSSTSGVSPSSLSTAGEERERRAFCEALRDGFVLCQLMNKLRGGNAVRPDPREDGFIRTSNVTRFLAGCASYGLGNEDLFQRDDLIEGTSESLARVAHTIITLIRFVETPAPSRIKWVTGASQRSKDTSPTSSAVPGPYMKGSIGRAAASTPNLLPQPASPQSRKRYSPPAGLPPLRSDSSEEVFGPISPIRSTHDTKKGSRANVNVLDPSDSEITATGDMTEREAGQEYNDKSRSDDAVVKSTPVTFVLKPPPKSPLRVRTIKHHQKLDDKGISEWARKAATPSISPTASRMRSDLVSPSAPRYELGLSRTDSVLVESTRASIGNSSFLESPVGLGLSSENGYARQSTASTAMTDTTAATQVSSILDHHPRLGRSSGDNKFGTVRTMTTDLTSESPSIGRAEGADIVEELTNGNRKLDLPSPLTPPTPPPKGLRERRGSNAHGHAVDLTRVAEEPDESGSSGGNRKEKLRLRDPKGKMVVEESPTKVRKSFEGGGGGGGGGGGERNEKPADRIRAVHLHKAKWPDDFLEAFQMRNTSSRSPSPPRGDTSLPAYSNPTPIARSVSPPRKIAIVGVGRRSDDFNEVACLAPRRPTHLSRHSLDTPGSSSSSSLLPKEASQLRRDVSPDGVRMASGPGSRLVVRRTSVNKSVLGQTRAGSSLSRYSPDAEGSEGRENPPDAMKREKRGSGGIKPVPVPFPRGDLSNTPSPSPRVDAATNLTRNVSNLTAAANSPDATAQEKQPRPLRGRFQSEINGSSRLKLRPNSYDEHVGKPLRTRIESMVNLGRADSGLASASDLMVRDSVDGSTVRKTLVVKEEGKPPTHFQLGNCIGKGQFGSVYRALNLNTGQMVAVKRLRLEGLKEDEISTLMREVDLLKSLSHPGIVKYEGMTRDDDTLNIVLEYAENGSLAHTLKAFGKLNEKLVASYVVKILEGLHYLHQSDVVHCDLKAANILTTKNGNVKLSDFGVSLNLRAMERQVHNDVAGTPNWMAPEVIELKGASTKSDIWSLGCTVIELLTGRPPYGEISNSMTVMFRIVENEMPIPEGCSELLQDFLEQCFNKNPVMRPNAELLCEHPWLKNNWGALKDLRPQDSIPFLRRVSADIQKSEMARYFANLPDSPTATESPRELPGPGSPSPPPPASPMGRRTSNASIHPASPVRDAEYRPSDHNFVKTTFSKPVVCRVCLENVKKSAVLCAKCSLIAHSKCAPNAPPTCDLRAQLLLYAHYAEQGNPAGLYSNPLLDHPEIPRGPTAMSDIPYVAHGPNVDTQHTHHTTSAQPASPPTAFKFMAAFKRSRSSLSNDAISSPGPQAPEGNIPDSAVGFKNTVSSTSVNKSDDPQFDGRAGRTRKRPAAVLHKRSRERSKSYTSSSTGLSSLRSATTAPESVNSSFAETGRRARLSGAGTASSHDRTSSSGVQTEQKIARKSISIKPQVPSGPVSNAKADIFSELSTASSILPRSLPSDTSRRTRSRRESKQSGNCIVQ